MLSFLDEWFYCVDAATDRDMKYVLMHFSISIFNIRSVEKKEKATGGL